MTYEILPEAIKAGVMEYAARNPGSIVDISGVTQTLTTTTLRYQHQIETQVTLRTLTREDVPDYIREFLDFARARSSEAGVLDVAAVDNATKEACQLWPDCEMIKRWFRRSSP